MSMPINEGRSFSIDLGDWKPCRVGEVPLYLNNTLKIATTETPVGKKKMKRLTKISKETGTYVLQPRPKDLPLEWEQAVALNPDGSGSFIYHSLKDGSTQFTDPRPAPGEGEDPLPVGWTTGVDEDGDTFYIDHNSGTTTYDDPRLVCLEDTSSLATIKETPDLELAVDEEEVPETHWKICAVDHVRFNDLKQNLTQKEKLPAEVVTRALNRYTNILPNPRTRVRLDDEHEPRTSISEYINANYVSSFDGQPREYIAAMGPLDCTIEAFWRMVLLNKSPAIVMTTPLMENGIVKCARYWPTVKYNEQKKVGDKKYGDISVSVLAGERQNGYIRTYIRVIKGDLTHFVSHFWFTEWPDHGVPATAQPVIEMMQTVRSHCQSAGGGPAIVHCSAGIGRTGTFIAIEHCTRLLDSTKTVDALDIIERLREARGGMVQHPQQYEFVYRACIEYAKAKSQPFAIIRPPVPPRPSISEGRNAPLAAASGSGSAASPGPDPKIATWKRLIKKGNILELSALVAKGKPDSMPELEWRKMKRAWEKEQAVQKAQNSVRRRLEEAELHGELRLGTLSGMSTGKYREHVQNVFEDCQ